MSTYQTPLKLKTIYAKTDLRFLLMFLGVVVVPLIILVGAGSPSLNPSRFNLFLSFLGLGLLLIASLSLGVVMFNRKARSLSISSRPAQLPAVNKHILWVEEDGAVREEITALLRNAGYRVSSTGDPVEVTILSMTGCYDLCLLGDWSDDEEESRIYQKIRKFNPECPILVYSLKPSQQNLQRGVEAGIWGHLTRPDHDFVLEDSIAALLEVAPSSVPRAV